jgi:hypothetical protein
LHCYDRVVRVTVPLFVCILAACTVNGSGPAPVTARPPADPNRMPNEVLDRQDPGADTSKNPVLSRSESHYVDPDGFAARTAQALSCGMIRCTSGHRSDSSVALIVLAVLATTRRRRRNKS